MWASGGKVPQIPLLEIVDEAAPLGIEYSHSTFALTSAEHSHGTYLDYIGPLALVMPVQFSVYSGAKTHVDTSQLFASR